MKKIIFCALCLINTHTIPLHAQESDADTQRYLFRMFNEPGFLADEFIKAAMSDPALAAYFVGLASHERCNFPPPSEQLKQASRSSEKIETEEGKRIFILSVGASSMKFPTHAQELSFCETTRTLVEAGEKAAEN